MDTKTQIKNMLKETWTQCVADGQMSKPELLESLLHTLLHDDEVWTDNFEELNETYAQMLGWDCTDIHTINHHITEEQCFIWDELVCEAETEYLIEQIKILCGQ